MKVIPLQKELQKLRIIIDYLKEHVLPSQTHFSSAAFNSLRSTRHALLLVKELQVPSSGLELYK